MSGRWTTAAAVLLLTVAGCGSDDGQISRSEFEEDGRTWPFNVDEAEVRCEGGAVIVTVDGTDWAANGLAQQDHPDITQVLADNPDTPGTKLSVSDVLDVGLDDC